MVERARWALAGVALAIACHGCRTAPEPLDSTPHPTPPTLPRETAPKTTKMYPTSPPRFLTLSPKSGAPRSLVVLLHGFGADATSFHEIAKALAPSVPQAELLTPEGFEPSELGGNGRQWFGASGLGDDDVRVARVRESASAVSTWIDQQLDVRGLPHDKLAIIGFSQGSMLAAWLAIHRVPSPAAVVMFSGRVAEGERPLAPKVGTAVLIAHGTDDTRIPISVLEPGAAVLESWGAHVTKRVYPGLGHSIDERELRDARAFLMGALTPQ